MAASTEGEAGTRKRQAPDNLEEAKERAVAVARKLQEQVDAPQAGAKSKQEAAPPVTEEVEINDYPNDVRNKVMKRSIQDQISRDSTATVSTKGVYYPPEQKPSSSDQGAQRPLYLLVREFFCHVKPFIIFSLGNRVRRQVESGLPPSASTEEKRRTVDECVRRIKEMLEGEKKQEHEQQQQQQQRGSSDKQEGEVSGSSSRQESSKSAFAQSPIGEVKHYDQNKAKLPLNFTPESTFFLRDRVEGPDRRFLAFIESSCGCTIFLHGHGLADNEPEEGPSIVIECSSSKFLSYAESLVTDLLKVVHNEWLKSHGLPSQVIGPPPAVPQAAPQQPGPAAPAPPGQPSAPTPPSMPAPQHQQPKPPPPPPQRPH